MNKLEILKLAFEKAKTAQEGMALAREMAAFVGGENTPIAPPQAPLRRGAPWKQNDVQRLIEMSNSGTPEHEMAAALGRNGQSIRTALYKIATRRQLGKPA